MMTRCGNTPLPGARGPPRYDASPGAPASSRAWSRRSGGESCSADFPGLLTALNSIADARIVRHTAVTAGGPRNTAADGGQCSP
jgi:hypothetical protein